MKKLTHSGKTGGGLIQQTCCRVALVVGVLFSGVSMAQLKSSVVLANLPGSCGGSGLSRPTGPLLFDGAGDLVGTTLASTQGGGGLFSLSPSGVFNVLDQFSSATRPALWTQGPDGNFYGVNPGTAVPLQSGSVFRMTPAGSITPLYTFTNMDNSGLNADGADPSVIVVGSDGNLYGVTYRGGAYGFGTVYKLSLNGVLTVLSARPSTAGDNPIALFEGTDGNFYGVAESGGANGNGSVFTFTPQGAYTVLHTFGALDGSGFNTDGAFPTSLVRRSDGTLFGTTVIGDTNGNGNIFTVATDGTFSSVHTFSAIDNAETNADGARPYTLISGLGGNFYGAASAGGPGATGIVFELTSSGSYSVLHDFNGLNGFDLNMGGAGPVALTLGGDGFLYGATSGGGCSAGGALFKINTIGYQNDDFDASGTADLLQFKASTQQLAVHLMDGTAVTGTYASAIAAGYYPVATGDFNGDGAVDILWTSANNDLYMWYGKAGSAGFTAAYAGTYPPGWRVFGAGDVNGDGKADLLWINPSTHQVGYWLMNGVTRIGSYVTSYASGYYPVATGDFDGDGLVDVVWTSAKSDLYIWLGNARKSTGFTPRYVTTFPVEWSVVGRGDIDGDGRDDLVWMNNANTMWGVWLMNGATIRNISTMYTMPGRTIATIGDFNDDGLADVVWNNGTGLELWTNSSALNVDGQTVVSFNNTTLVGFDAGTPVFNSGIPFPAVAH